MRELIVVAVRPAGAARPEASAGLILACYEAGGRVAISAIPLEIDRRPVDPKAAAVKVFAVAAERLWLDQVVVEFFRLHVRVSLPLSLAEGQQLIDHLDDCLSRPDADDAACL